MVPFHLEVELNQGTVGLEVEQLDYLADEQGFIRYDVRTHDRRAVISVPVEPLSNENEIRFEAVQAINEGFCDEDMATIMTAIRLYNQQLSLYYKNFMNRNKM